MDLHQSVGFAMVKYTWKIFIMNRMDSITDAVNGVWEFLHEDHEWIPHKSHCAPRKPSFGMSEL